MLEVKHEGKQNTYPRGLGKDEARLLLGGKEVLLTRSKVFEKLGVASFVRVPEVDYPEKAEPGDVFTHFGLPIRGDSSGTIVALPRILRNGYFTEKGEESLPLLSLENVWIAEIKNCIESISYDLLPDDCFENTIGGVYDNFELQDMLVARYSKALPGQSREEILSQGVSIRYIRLIRRISYR